MWQIPTLTPALFMGTIAVFIVALLAWAGLLIYQRHFSLRSRILQRLHSQRRTLAQSDERPQWGAGWRQHVVALPLLDAKQRAEVQRKLIAAGYRHPDAQVILMTIIAVSGLACAALAMLWIWPLTDRLHWLASPAAALIGLYLGIILPRIVLDKIVINRQKAIQKALPDALDLMIICVNAGLGLNATLQRMARDLRTISPELADEFVVTAADAQLRGSATSALRLLGERINLPAIQNLVSTLAMAQRYGTPMAQALRVLAESERTNRLLHLEEKAGKLSTKITIPMMLFIMPTVLIVAAGPAVINLMDVL